MDHMLGKTTIGAVKTTFTGVKRVTTARWPIP